MLSTPERILFVAALVTALYLALRKFLHKAHLVASGRPVSRWDHPGRRIGGAIARVLFQTPVMANRPVTGLFHAFIFWGFFVFALVTL
ncbi:MAG TPA: [Fe-S]-binding protein, partial [Candidatus Aminicenantes bacterium]|nr:[Fe-S]-binding protein [Candidatus Aminicenantes bacterium]